MSIFYTEAGNSLPLKKHHPASPELQRRRSGGIHVRVTILAESLRHFNGLAVGETAAILSEAKVECGGGSFSRC